eukprot:CAMPEP_0174265284 /NCGR_PEP_ID=MMETSP0439-20130205/25948_1 /TAXON_ID=0 /ORGANISM="Stereomyxa ramosa, Strain Chinc5" /LENGTH=1033 /DNA_ID=CAMNT_0015351673 /DNA_START=86 /DNA_END=3184 /DNA_ORIENTATION=+
MEHRKRGKKKEGQMEYYVRKTKKKGSNCWSFAVSLIPNAGLLVQFLRQTFREMKHKKLNYILGCLACVMVVVVSSVMMSFYGNTPIAWLRMAELKGGEMDFRFGMGSWTGYETVNYTQVANNLDQTKSTSAHAPRFKIYNVPLIPVSKCKLEEYGLNINDTYWRYYGVGINHTFYDIPCDEEEEGEEVCNSMITPCWNYTYQYPGCCFADVCGSMAYLGKILLIDSKREKDIELGRSWDKPPLEKGYAYVHKKLLKHLGASVGDTIFLKLSLPSDLPGIYDAVVKPFFDKGIRPGSDAFSKVNDTIYWQAFVPVKVKEKYKKPEGKTGEDDDSVLIMEYEHFIDSIVQNLNPNTPQQIIQSWKSIDLYHYAYEVVVNFENPRTKAYMETDYEVILQTVSSWSSDIAYRLGFSQMWTYTPVLNNLEDTRFDNLFLGLIFNIVVTILMGLSVLLIYSLLMVNVETRTFEMGVMRLIGTTRVGIVQLLLIQAISYALPSWAIGLAIAQGMMHLVSHIFENVTGVELEPKLTMQGAVVGTLLGLLTPILASILPIRYALTLNLHDSLDLKHAKVQAVSVKLERSENSNFGSSLVITGSLLAVMGFSIYYVMPLSLLTLNFTLLLNLFFLLLVGMLLGLVILSINLEPLLEKIIVGTLLVWEKVAVTTIVLKNLIAHRRRNRKTSVMYAMSVGFIIFLMISYSSIMNAIIYARQVDMGNILYVQGDYRHQGISKGFPPQIIQKLENYTVYSDHISDFAYSTSAIQSTYEHSGWSPSHTFSDLAGLKTVNADLRGVTPNFLNTVHSEYNSISEGSQLKDGMLLDEQLYTPQGSGGVWLGTHLKSRLGASLYGKVLSSLTIIDRDNYFIQGEDDDHKLDEAPPEILIRTLLQPIVFFDHMAFFRNSKFHRDTIDPIISFPSYLRNSHGYYNSMEDIPIKIMHLKIKEEYRSNNKVIDSIVHDLEELIEDEDDDDISIKDYRDGMDALDIAQTIVSYFFIVTIFAAMLISSFSLTSAMYTNIDQQTKEIGILRALGLKPFW